MSDAQSLRSVRTNSSRYVPMEHTATSVLHDLKNTSDKDAVLHKIFVHEDSDSILSHLVTNPETAPTLKNYIGRDVKSSVHNMREYSDPKFQALGLFTVRNPDLLPQILEALKELLDQGDYTGLAVLVRLKPESIELELVPKVLECLLSEDYEHVAIAVVVLAKLLHSDETAAKAREIVESRVKHLLSDQNKDNVSVSFQAIGYLFSIDQSLASSLFTNLPTINSELWSDQRVTVLGLEMFSSACVVKDLRPQIYKNYGSLLESAKASHNRQTKLVASAVWTKLIASGTLTEDIPKLLKDMDGYSEIFEKYILDHVPTKRRATLDRDPVLFTAIEAYAITSELTSVRLRLDPEMLARLAFIVRCNEAAWVYGALSALDNLTKYPYKLTKDEQKVRDLKEKSGTLGVFDIQPTIEHADVLKIAEMILETDIIAFLSNASQKLSVSAREKVALFLQGLAGNQQNQIRTTLASQGALVICVYLWVDEKTPLDLKAKSIAASAIAKILCHADPTKSFTERFTPLMVIAPLKSQLKNPESGRPNLDTFEALMALTNIASIQSDSINKLIVSKCWSKIEECLETDLIQVQKSVLELVCNLSLSQATADRVLAHNQHGQFWRDVLGHGLEIDDMGAKIAAAGALAILVNYPDAAELFGHNVTIMEQLILNLESDDQELLLRVVTALHDIMVRSLKHDDDEAIEAVIYYGGVSRIEGVVDKVDTNNKELGKIVLKTIKLLAHFRVRRPPGQSA